MMKDDETTQPAAAADDKDVEAVNQAEGKRESATERTTDLEVITFYHHQKQQHYENPPHLKWHLNKKAVYLIVFGLCALIVVMGFVIAFGDKEDEDA